MTCIGQLINEWSSSPFSKANALNTRNRKHLLKWALIALILVSLNPSALARDPADKLHFKRLSIENGLSGNIINAIIEDTYGYIWIATPIGLNRFDGLKVTVFSYNPADTASIPSNEVAALAVDLSGNLWVGTKKGLCRFNYETEKFESHLQYGPGERNVISTLYVDKKDQLWVGTEHGIFRFEKKGFEFVKMIAGDEMNLFAPICFTEYANGTLLAGTWEKGFYRIDETRRSHTRESINIPGRRLIGLNTIRSILIDPNNTLWLASREGIIKAREKYEIGSSKYEYSFFQDELAPDDKMTDLNVHALCEDNSGRLWIGTEYGLSIYDPGTRRNIQYFNDPSDPYSLSNNLIQCIFKDRNGNIWLGTYQGGVNIYHPNQERFRNYFPAINNALDQKMRYVKSIYQDSRQTIWIGTDMGLLKFSNDGQLLKTYVNDPLKPNSINVGGVTAIREDKKGRFWVGTWGGGLHEMNRETDCFNRLPWIEGVHDNIKTQGDINIRSIAEDSHGNLWLGSMRGYLDMYNPESKSFEHFRITLNELDINAIILAVAVDKYDNIWLGTQGGGLIKMNAKTRKLKRFYGLSNSENPSDSILNSTDVYSLTFSGDNQLWLGTNNGTHVLDLKTNRFQSYTTKDGLPGNTVYSVYNDNVGNLWLSGLKGVSRFNPATRAFVNYDGRDGIRINSECGFKSLSGWLFFGGVNGINVINPASIQENFVIPPIVFTDFKVLNKSVQIGESSILKKHINFVDEVAVDYSQNVISIEFAALNFVNSEKNQYACKLEGFDKDWVSLGSANENRYTNLSPGNYSFHVIASNNDGAWNDKGRILKITVLPPWWKTWWFRLLILLTLFLIILAWILVRTFSLREQQKRLKKLVLERTAEIESQKLQLQQQADMLLHSNQLLEDQKNQISEQRQREQELAEKLHDADQLKLRFFTNISHEFRTPLTLILGPIEKLIAEFGNHKGFAELGKVIQRNTLRLLNLINQFLDLSRMEAGVVHLNISEGDIFAYINGIVNAYQYAATQKNIQYHFVSDVDSKNCFFDADKIEKILYNLLSNAFKFTPSGGKIEVSVRFLNSNNQETAEAETISISISDTGKGIPSEYLDRVFQRFYQIDSNGSPQISGTGIGLALTNDLITIYRGTISVESTVGEGTTFVVGLPISKASFQPDEITPGLPIIDDLKHQLISAEDHKYEDALAETADEGFDSNSDDIDDEVGDTLLIVDDNPDIRKYLINQLGKDYRIIEARDGQEGLDKALRFLPKLVICDVMMPRMDGYELCAHLKTDMQTCHIPVIILTAKVSPEDQLESIETGADAYFAKPFDIRLLETQVHQLISGREQLKQLFRKEMTIGPTNIVVESSEEKLMSRIIKIMSDNISNPDFGVEELGREVGLSRTHLYRKLKQLTNNTAVEFVRNMRLQRAAQLFKQKKLYVAEVAYMCGFKELSYFRKIFREVYGMSPQEYVNNCKE